MSKVKCSLLPGVLFGVALLLIVPVDPGFGDIELVAPDVDVAEGDRQVGITWKDMSPEDLVAVDQPVLGTISFPWLGNAGIGSGGFYVGACDWTFNVLVQVVLDTVEFSWQEVIDWRDMRVVPRRVQAMDVEVVYDLSSGIQVKVDSAGLYAADTVGWGGPLPRFHGLYLGGDSTVADSPDSFYFYCASGGELTAEGGGIEFEWSVHPEGVGGDFTVDAAGSTIDVFRDFKITFPAGTYITGESFRAKAALPVVSGDRFAVPARTFEGYMVLRRSVEDRSDMYKVRANISKCDTFEFFQDDEGNPDPYGEREFIDLGVVGEQPGVTPDSLKQTVLNGFPYDYAVVTWDWSETHEQVLSPINWQLVYPSMAPTSGVDNVSVVPNPYIVRAGWEVDESKLMFINIPADAAIRIYDVAGGFVGTVSPETYSFNPSLNQGSASWNLKNAEGEDVVSGIYIYQIESSTGSKTGRFIVIR